MAASEVIQIRIGRSESNDLTIPHASVSSQHCVISFTDGQWILEDLKSTNGTFVNGERVSRGSLKNGDQVLLGLVACRFSNGELKLEATHPESSTPSQPSIGRASQRKNLAAIGLSTVALVIVVGVTLIASNRDGSTETRNVEQTIVGKDVDLFSQPSTLSEIIETARESVLGVECGESSGTGWVLSTGGDTLVVTNHHVVADCVGRSSPRLSLDGVAVSASIVGGDEYTDLAVLKTTRSLTSLPTASPPPVGSWLMVIGNPIGLDRSINYGTLTNNAEGLLITDAAINPGNSGGPVFNSKGEVIGVASAKLVAEGIDRIGIVIPLSDLCLEVLECSVGQWR